MTTFMQLVYGEVPLQAPDAAAWVQTHPCIVGSALLPTINDASCSAVHIAAPAGTLERRYVLAHGLRVLADGGVLMVSAAKKKGGTRLRKELEAFGCVVDEQAHQHARFCRCVRPAIIHGLSDILTQGGLHYVASIQRWSQPGIFSWDRIDAGSKLLLASIPDFSGVGADLGCGNGLLSQQVLQSVGVTALHVLDIDGRAIAAIARTISDARLHAHWQDVREASLNALDFVVMNPPFHDGGMEDKYLGQQFISAAAGMLKRGGVCWLVANRQLPYEQPLRQYFSAVRMHNETNLYKVIEAVK